MLTRENIREHIDKQLEIQMELANEYVERGMAAHASFASERIAHYRAIIWHLEHLDALATEEDDTEWDETPGTETSA